MWLVRTHAHKRLPAHARAHAHVYSRARTHALMRIRMHARMDTHMHTFTSAGAYRVIAFFLVTNGLLLHCHLMERMAVKEMANEIEKAALHKSLDDLCVPEATLNFFTWGLLACALLLVLGGFVYDLRRKKYVEQFLPEYIVDEGSKAKATKKKVNDQPPELRWFWLNTVSHHRLAQWFHMESLLGDVATVEGSMARWFHRILAKDQSNNQSTWVKRFKSVAGSVKLPVNHYHLVEKQEPTVYFLSEILKDAPAFIDYILSMAPDQSKALRMLISDWHTYQAANPHEGYIHQLLKPAMVPYVTPLSPAMRAHAFHDCLAGTLLLGCWRHKTWMRERAGPKYARDGKEKSCQRPRRSRTAWMPLQGRTGGSFSMSSTRAKMGRSASGSCWG